VPSRPPHGRYGRRYVDVGFAVMRTSLVQLRAEMTFHQSRPTRSNVRLHTKQISRQATLEAIDYLAQRKLWLRFAVSKS